MADRPRTPLTLGAIAAVLYFSEGFPFGIVNDLVPIYLRIEHIQLKTIGLASGVSIAWTLKFLWSPLVDTFGTYRRWIAGAIVATSDGFALAAVTLTSKNGQPPRVCTIFVGAIAPP